MNYKRFGRTNWQVSAIGYGMWGMAGWKGTDLDETNRAMDKAVELGANFFDTAWGYGEGKSEELLAALIKRHPQKTIYGATKIPPKNLSWPSKPHFTIQEVFPAAHIIEYTEKSLKNLKLECMDLQQFHVWEDAWANQDEWKNAVEKLKKEGKVRHFGVSVNRWEPNNCLKTLETGLIDSVQVIYNIFDQAPEDHLIPLCKKLDIAIIARVPFDEGTLTGTFTKDTVFPEGDWRRLYFVPENFIPSVERADALKPLVPQGLTMAQMALKFIIQNPDVATTIPGMRKMNHVLSNLSSADGNPLSVDLMQTLKKHRWDRVPTEWSM